MPTVQDDFFSYVSFYGRCGGLRANSIEGTMTRIARTLLMALVAAVAVSAGASAASYDNLGSLTGQEGSYFGYPNTTAFGQVFTAPESTLNSWKFLISTDSPGGNAKFVIAPWNGTAAVGPAIYESAAFWINNISVVDYALNGVDNIAVPLSIGQQYVAYFSVAGVIDPVTQTKWAAAGSNGGLGGGNTFNNSAGLDPLISLAGWVTPGTFLAGNWAFTAEFSTAATTPIPAALPLFASALGGLGLVGWRRKKARAA